MIPRHVCWACSGQIPQSWAALGDLGLALERLGAGLAETLDVEIALGIAVDDGLEPAVVWARPAEDHATALDDELGAENRPAARADRLRARQHAPFPRLSGDGCDTRFDPEGLHQSVPTSGVKMRSLQRPWRT